MAEREWKELAIKREIDKSETVDEPRKLSSMNLNNFWKKKQIDKFYYLLRRSNGWKIGAKT